jgi:hypothetical protein
MVVALDSIQPVFPLPPPDSIADEQDDQPRPGRALVDYSSLASQYVVLQVLIQAMYVTGIDWARRNTCSCLWRCCMVAFPQRGERARERYSVSSDPSSSTVCSFVYLGPIEH